MEGQSSFQEDNEFPSIARMMNHELRNQVRKVEAICYLRFRAYSVMLIRATTNNDCP